MTTNTTGLTEANYNVYELAKALKDVDGGQLFFPMILVVMTVIVYLSLSTRYSGESSLMAAFFLGSMVSITMVMADLLSMQIATFYIGMVMIIGFVAILRK